MKTKLSIYSQPTYLFRTAIEAKILFAVCLIKCGFWSGSVKTPPEKSPCSKKIGAVLVQQADRHSFEASAMLTLVYFYIIMIIHKCQQSEAQSCLGTFELRVLPFGKTSGFKLLNLLNIPTDRTFENRRSRYKELGKKVPQAYRVYVEDTFLPCDAGDARIFSKEETGLYYYGARYLDPKYSRWLSGDPALGEYIPSPGTEPNKLAGVGGVYNTINLHVYHYAGNNPVKYTDPDGKILRIAGSNSYKNQVMSVLKKLDPNVKINMRTGIVTTSSTNNSAGAKLIRNLQVSKNTVTIMNDSSIGTAPKSREKAETPGIGSDSIVYFSINVKLSNDYFIRDENGNIEKAKHTPAEIVLGHELIHGLHYADGTGDNSTDDYTFITSGFQDGKYKSGEVVFKGGLFHDKYPREEARTIGVGEFSNDPITENALRRQLKYNERLTH